MIMLSFRKRLAYPVEAPCSRAPRTVSCRSLIGDVRSNRVRTGKRSGYGRYNRGTTSMIRVRQVGAGTSGRIRLERWTNYEVTCGVMLTSDNLQGMLWCDVDVIGFWPESSIQVGNA